MNKTELIDGVAAAADLSKAEAGRAVDAVIAEITKALKKGDAVTLVGFGTFQVRERAERTGDELPLGQLDITFHRDDVSVRGGAAPRRPQPVVRDTRLGFDLSGMTVILVDDVLYTGRTIRAAIDALFEFGRPARVQLAVLADRGHRELPIRPDYVGKNLPTSRGERVQVELVEIDEVDRVLLVGEREEASDD